MYFELSAVVAAHEYLEEDELEKVRDFLRYVKRYYGKKYTFRLEGEMGAGLYHKTTLVHKRKKYCESVVLEEYGKVYSKAMA